MAAELAVDGDHTGQALGISGTGFSSTQDLSLEIYAPDGDDVLTADVTCSSGDFTLDTKYATEDPGVLKIIAKDTSDGTVLATLEHTIFIGA